MSAPARAQADPPRGGSGSQPVELALGDALALLADLHGGSVVRQPELAATLRVEIPRALLDEPEAFRRALAMQQVEVVEVDEAKGRVVLYAFSARNVGMELPRVVQPRHLKLEDAIPERNVYVEKVLPLRAGGALAEQILIAVRAHMAQDPLRLASLTHIPDAHIVVITDLAPRVARYAALIASLDRAGATPPPADEVEEEEDGIRVGRPVERAERPAERLPSDPELQLDVDATLEAAALADPLVGPLRAAHRARDEGSIHAEEQALIARGADAVEDLRIASEREKQFNLKVSLEYVLLAIEGRATVPAIVERLRTTKDAGEKMRLAFMLGKLRGPEHAAALDHALATERDPMVRKYVLRALGNAEGDAGVAALMRILRDDDDRNMRIEALRALEGRLEAGVEDQGREAALAALGDVAADEDEDDAQLRSIAVRAYASVAPSSAAPFFQRIIEHDDRTNNRAEAAKFFARAGVEADIPRLQELIARERVYYIRAKMTQAIDEIRKRAPQ